MKNLSLFFLLLLSIGIYSCKKCQECPTCPPCPDHREVMKHPKIVCIDTIILSKDISDVSPENSEIKHITLKDTAFYCFHSNLKPHIDSGTKVKLCRYNYHISAGEYDLQNDLKGTFWITAPTNNQKDFESFTANAWRGQVGCEHFYKYEDLKFESIEGTSYLKMKMHYHESDTVFYPEYYKISQSERSFLEFIAKEVFKQKKVFGVGVDKLPDLIVGTSSSRENAHNTIKLVVDLDN